jgi:hypothetical protein
MFAEIESCCVKLQNFSGKPDYKAGAEMLHREHRFGDLVAVLRATAHISFLDGACRTGIYFV